MMTPANFRIVDGSGKVHYQNITSTQADAFMSLLLAGGQCPGLRSEPMAKPPQTEGQAMGIPHIAATAMPLPDIKPGKERDALRDAIETHLDASARLDAANQAVERARAFVDARQTELDALQALHQDEIRNAGSNLAETFKAGGAAFEAGRVIDRSAVLDAEVRRDTAKAALEHLIAEQVESDSTYKAADRRTARRDGCQAC